MSSSGQPLLASLVQLCRILLRGRWYMSAAPAGVHLGHHSLRGRQVGVRFVILSEGHALLVDSSGGLGSSLARLLKSMSLLAFLSSALRCRFSTVDSSGHCVPLHARCWFFCSFSFLLVSWARPSKYSLPLVLPSSRVLLAAGRSCIAFERRKKVEPANVVF